MATASDELVLLERVFLRIGSAESDEQLQNVLDKFLPPVLLKLASQQEGVRKKVMELLVHVNKRVKTRPLVRLPVDALLQQYHDPESTSFVINFTIIYLKIGFPRLSHDEQVELVPKILNALEGKPQTHQDSLLLLIIPLLGKVKIPTDPLKRASLFELNKKPQISKHLLGLLLDMILLPYGALSPQTEQTPSNPDVTLPIPPGMSEYTFKRVTSDNPLRPEDLEQIKVGIVKFIANEIFPNEEILIHLIVAAADTRFSVANLADNELKKVVGSLDWGSPTISLPLFMLFLGAQSQNIKPNLKKSPANTRIRLKLLTYLGRVTGNGFVLPPSIQVIFDSLYGVNTNPRLKTLALNFSLNLVQYGDEAQLSKMINVLKSGMIKLINEGEVAHQGQAFLVIGMISRKFPFVVNEDASLIDMFFKKLETAEPELKLQIREAALNVITAFKYNSEKSESQQIDLLFAYLKQYQNSPEPMVRFVVARSLATFFAPNHVPSKILLLLSTGDPKDEVANEAMKSLYGTIRKTDIDMSKKETLKVILPSFSEIIKYVYEESEARLKDVKMRYSVGTQFLPFPATIFIEILLYVRLCLIQDLEVPLTRDVMKHPCDETPILKDYLQKLYKEGNDSHENALWQYVSLVRYSLLANPTLEPLSCMLELIGCVPKLHTVMKNDIIWVRDLINATKEEVREYAAMLYGVIINEAYGDKEFDEAVKYMITQTNNKSLETQSGAIMSLASALERKLMHKKSDKNVKQVLDVILPFLNNNNQMLIAPACIAVGLIGKSCALPLDSGEVKDIASSPDAKRPAILYTKLSVVNSLLDIMNNAKYSAKCREKAARTLGLICVGEHFPFTKEVVQGFLNTVKETKDVEVHFTIGESLVMCVQGVWSPEARDAWCVTPSDFKCFTGNDLTSSDKTLEWLVQELLNFANSLNPNSKQAACIWLLALIKNCVEREPINKQLKVIQYTFMSLLGENNDIVQDVASKGLCLIYDYSKSEELLTALVDQLTVGRRQAVQVSENTKLFEEGQLGKTPSGGNLSTYKELCSLASELNKPDLIYQFMHLANHNAIWNSKKGAAFGFSSIAEKCGERLQQYLPTIIPKLYRYQYDPSPNLQASMGNIWHTLVQEPQKMLELYHNEILLELVNNLTSNQYRVRQSCCLALQDFLKGAGNRSIHDSVHKMDEIWSKLFRVMDDHHEQTRLAATKTTRVLSKLCIRGCDVGQGKAGNAMMEAILPVLLNNGITNPVQEVRLISLQTISELVGSAGKQLKPFLGKLIPALILATGELESSKLSYLSNIYGAQSQMQEVVDSARTSMAKSQFTTETVTKCIQYADASILEELVPKVTELMKSNTGLGTRVVCAHFITLLALQLGKDLQPYTGKFLAALVNGLTDRNASIRKQYAAAIGHLVSTAKDSSLEKLFAKIQHWYFEREDDAIRSACALTIQSIGNHNQEILKSYSDIVLPLVFFAMHAEKTPETENTLELWNEIWAEQSPGTESGIRQNIEVICDTLKTALESPSWTMKAQAANAVSTVASKLGTTMEAKHRNILIQILVSGLSGRTWNGKEKLLKALSSICSNCKDGLQADEAVDVQIIIESVIKECRKDEIVYKRCALESLGDILSFLEVDKFEEVYKIVENILSAGGSSYKDSDDEDISTEEANSKRENILKLQEMVYQTLGKSWPKDSKETQNKFSVMFVEHCVSSIPTTTRNVQVAIVGALYNFVDKLLLLTESNPTDEDLEMLDKIVTEIEKALTYGLSISKHTRLRKEVLNVLLSLAKKLDGTRNAKYFDKLSLLFKNNLNELLKDNQPEVKSRVMDLKVVFKN